MKPSPVLITKNRLLSVSGVADILTFHPIEIRGVYSTQRQAVGTHSPSRFGAPSQRYSFRPPKTGSLDPPIGADFHGRRRPGFVPPTCEDPGLPPADFLRTDHLHLRALQPSSEAAQELKLLTA